ncbi:MAG: hypothetical protein COY80_01790 [Candidatus Pacebacteria bacterium CG_4_10_14_0_8_um_filter_42_14]|nr:MAG: hypothetical protein COY80_01790 [Candidatus Pacebacteria bacterium CG_4_10_14_0_8_um_filter_42_14]
MEGRSWSPEGRIEKDGAAASDRLPAVVPGEPTPRMSRLIEERIDAATAPSAVLTTEEQAAQDTKLRQLQAKMQEAAPPRSEEARIQDRVDRLLRGLD